MKLILGVDALPTTEVNLLKTILRLSSQLANRWELGESRNCNVLFQDASAYSAPEVNSIGTQFVVAVTRPADQVSAPKTLVRPIRIGEVETLLAEFEQLIARSAGKVAVNVAAVGRTHMAMMAQYFKLKRWPPQNMLSGSAEKIQLATFLSRRPVTMTQLSELSGKSIETCCSFVQSLDLMGLLRWESDEPAMAAAPAAVSAQPAAARGARGLLSSIRRRLGLI